MAAGLHDAELCDQESAQVSGELQATGLNGLTSAYVSWLLDFVQQASSLPPVRWTGVWSNTYEAKRFVGIHGSITALRRL